MESTLYRNTTASDSGAPKVYWPLCAFSAMLIIMGTFNKVFSLGAFLLTALITFFFLNENDALIVLMFQMSYANIYKLSASSTSLFTYLVLLFGIKLFLNRGRFSSRVVVFFIYELLHMFLFQLIENTEILYLIKLFAYLIIISSVFDGTTKYHTDQLYLSYTLGVLSASASRFLDSSFFKISEYVITKSEQIGKSTSRTDRFSGLYNDPNFYAVNVIISLCLLVFLYHRKKINLMTFAALAAPLMYFAMLTCSKSAILMLAVPVMLFLYSNQKTQKYALQLSVICIGILAVVALIASDSPIINNILSRFNNKDFGSGSTVSSLTTGRTDIWMAIIETWSNIRIPLLGAGVLKDMENAHNTYIEIINSFGVIGGGILISVIQEAIDINAIKKRTFLNYGLLVCILMMYMFIHETFTFDVPFHMILMISSLNIDLPVSQSEDRVQSIRRQNI